MKRIPPILALPLFAMLAACGPHVLTDIPPDQGSDDPVHDDRPKGPPEKCAPCGTPGQNVYQF